VLFQWYVGTITKVVGEGTMTKANQLILKARIWSDTRGQDLVEYALIMGLMAMAAASLMSGLSVNISRVLSVVNSQISPVATPIGAG
jgi:Flp pilus assembly pilin Flp